MKVYFVLGVTFWYWVIKSCVGCRIPKMAYPIVRICSQNINPSVTPKNVSIDFLNVVAKSGSDDIRVIKISVTVTAVSSLIQ